MTETKQKAAPKAKKETAAKSEKKAAGGKKIKVIQIGSPIGRQKNQGQSLVGLGLGKIRDERVLEDTPAVRGMIFRVKHLVKVVDAA